MTDSTAASITDPATEAASSAPPLTENDLLDGTVKLHAAREAEAAVRAAVKEALDEWHASRPAWIGELEAQLKQAKENREWIEGMVRLMAVRVAKASGFRKFACGVEVVTVRSWDWQDEPAVLAWARGSGIGLKLDSRAIEKVAAASPGVVPGLVQVESLGTRIATDLSLALHVIGALTDAPADAGGAS